ncbi:hypothetical protein DVJ78_07120 [Humibacter sp. BT305]|uniref:DUF7882 domain-containing protein n=1 Tax=Cnuibacter physcomitrellae TaxID=1619308 RepID=A0A1X9LSK7_9MICO|nr:hypothetical protein [Cnuibacter physcomitrellae]ARJ06129.1 hypothetical protein B5808_13535 [Cnuibacter physcomitrellae]AXH35206.1 hypothetical protein DVJ78_07120 [Humibacter sp. BT305]MCS5496096.1 hypothetical protein [Cnuibacter physcomitrellae]GGI37284.1 hypothetical protein GCM10010988_13180 [Cnuibacter physcomitrellae]
MGALLYGSSQDSIPLDDRTLAHLQLVILGRLRRGESCGLTYTREDGGSSTRETIWINPAIPMRFVYDSLDRGGPLNRAWVEALAATAAQGDLHPVPEPDGVPATAVLSGAAKRTLRR